MSLLGFMVQFSLMTTLFTAVVHQQSEVGHTIQGAIRCATDWAKSWGLKFSTQKTKAVRFTWARWREEISTLFLENSILPYEGKVKYLGNVLDKKLTFGHHITEVVSDVRHHLNVLKVVSHFNWGADRTALLRLYTVLFKQDWLWLPGLQFSL